MNSAFNPGDYVLATKYSDGDPGDQYCVGFYSGSYDNGGTMRHLVVDNNGKNFRANGFRRVEKIVHDEGVYLISQFPNFVPFDIEEDKDGEDRIVGKSVWDWLYEFRKGSHGDTNTHTS